MAKPRAQKAQVQDQQPGIEADMQPKPEFIREEETARLVGEHGAECIPIQGDITDPGCAPRAVADFIRRMRPRLDILVNNAAAQWPQDNVEEDASYMTGRTLHPNGGSFVAT